MAQMLQCTGLPAAMEAIVWNEDDFVTLLGKLIGETKYLQNNPPELIPIEDRGALQDSLRKFIWCSYATATVHHENAMIHHESAYV
eukprot:scaffold225803_cov38-Prasinocladus_malaysianus.AAC.2